MYFKDSKCYNLSNFPDYIWPTIVNYRDHRASLCSPLHSPLGRSSPTHFGGPSKRWCLQYQGYKLGVRGPNFALMVNWSEILVLW